MEYLSPFHLLGKEFAPGEVPQIEYQRLKKRVLAQFELYDNQPIVLRGIEINKSDALKMLMELKDETTYGYHVSIHSNRGLFYFLENGIVPRKNFMDVPEDPGFKKFISPYFALSYGKKLASYIKDARDIKDLFSFDLSNFVEVEDMHTVWRKTESFLTGAIADLDAISFEDLSEEEFVKACEERYHQYVGPQEAENLNRLPSYFEDLRGQLGRSVYRLIIPLHNEVRYFHLTFVMAEFLMHLELPKSQKEDIEKMFKIVARSFQG